MTALKYKQLFIAISLIVAYLTLFGVFDIPIFNLRYNYISCSGCVIDHFISAYLTFLSCADESMIPFTPIIVTQKVDGWLHTYQWVMFQESQDHFFRVAEVHHLEL